MDSKALKKMCYAFLVETENTSGFRAEENTPDDIEVIYQGYMVGVRFRNMCSNGGHSHTEIHHMDLLAFALSKITNNPEKSHPPESNPAFEYNISFDPSSGKNYLELLGLPRVVDMQEDTGVVNFVDGFKYKFTDVKDIRGDSENGLEMKLSRELPYVPGRLLLSHRLKSSLASAASLICTEYTNWREANREEESFIAQALQKANPSFPVSQKSNDTHGK